MLAAIGETRERVHVAAICWARPASGQIPADDATQLKRIIRHHLALIAPERLILFGQAANRAVIEPDAVELRGHLHLVNHNHGQSRTVATFHPRFLIERPGAKAEAWRDLQLLIRGNS